MNELSKRELGSSNFTQAAENYRTLKSIITNSIKPYPFNIVIEEILGISSKSYYNYLKGTTAGKISVYTISKLTEYFNIDKAAFKGDRSFKADEIQKITDVLIRNYKNNSPKSEDNSCNYPSLDLETRMKAEIQFIKKQSDLETLKRLKKYFNTLHLYTEKYIELLEMEGNNLD